MLKPNQDDQIPEETVKVAKAAFPNGKCIPGLKLDDPGFDFSVLSEFRQRLLEGKAEARLLEKLLERCETLGFLKGKKKQRTDSTHVIAAVRALSLLELVGETMRRVLDEAAQIAPDWLRTHLKPEWVKRYARRFDGYHLPTSKSWQDRVERAFDHTQFQIDWEKRMVTCPNGKTSARATDRKTWRGTPEANPHFPILGFGYPNITSPTNSSSCMIELLLQMSIIFQLLPFTP